jgi:predicted protein tyrosine phosphatase
MKLYMLFVCSINQWRSPTAENIFKKHSLINVKSAGTEPSARRRVNEKDIFWAYIIFVMEKKHKQRIAQRFPESIQNKQIVILDIEDNYPFMDPELVAEIEAKVVPFLPN